MWAAPKLGMQEAVSSEPLGVGVGAAGEDSLSAGCWPGQARFWRMTSRAVRSHTGAM